ncbi:hypothetical protein COU57_06270 [Candidatus Pacearchaeota archaeon CG10_big_fil_rev_8_21_14_0_10_32_14]|nr:MAG: hypothetical protein COU57_06270 [Candidatus Pacearchaeota archaeon CG10_big_fil_rev_8_21_14_0_10_32_14]
MKKGSSFICIILLLVLTLNLISIQAQVLNPSVNPPLNTQTLNSQNQSSISKIWQPVKEKLTLAKEKTFGFFNNVGGFLGINTQKLTGFKSFDENSDYLDWSKISKGSIALIVVFYLFFGIIISSIYVTLNPTANNSAKGMILGIFCLIFCITVIIGTIIGFLPFGFYYLRIGLAALIFFGIERVALIIFFFEDEDLSGESSTSKKWMIIITLLLIYQILILIPFVNRIVQIITLEFTGIHWILISFILYFEISIVPRILSKYVEYKIRTRKYDQALKKVAGEEALRAISR